MRIWPLFGQIVVLLVAGLVTACGSAVEPASSPAAPPNATASGPLLAIGAPLALPGSLAAEGNLTKNGYDLWVDEVNKAGGIRVGRQRRMGQIKYYDDESDAQKSAQFAERLILEEGVRLLLGPSGSAATTRVAEIAERYQVPMVEGNGAAESTFSRGYEYTFGVLSPARQYAAVMVALAAQQIPKPASVAILFASDAFSVEVAEGAKALAQSQGIKVSFYERYQVNSTDLSGGVTAAKVASAEMLLNSGHLVESLAIMKASKIGRVISDRLVDDISGDDAVQRRVLGPRRRPDHLGLLYVGAWLPGIITGRDGVGAIGSTIKEWQYWSREGWWWLR